MDALQHIILFFSHIFDCMNKISSPYVALWHEKYMLSPNDIFVSACHIYNVWLNAVILCKKASLVTIIPMVLWMKLIQSNRYIIDIEWHNCED